MQTPTFTTTQYILNYIVRYEIAMERIKSTNLPEMYFNEVYERIRADDIDKMGELIGNSIGYSKALMVQRGKILPTGKSKDRIFTNIRSVHDFINVYSAATYYKPSAELMVHINKLLTKGILDEWEAGRLRTFSEKPNSLFDGWYKLRDFFPNLKPKRHLDEIFTWMNSQKNVPHKLIQMAILLYEIIDKAHFTAFNQITGITTLAIFAKEYGYNHRNVIPFVKAINQISEEIMSAFKISKSKKDLTIFIETVLYTLALTADEVSAQFKAAYNTKVKNFSKLDDSLNSRQVKILEILEKEKKITRIQYSKAMGISFMTAFRDLHEMLELKYIKQKGVGRGTYYIINKLESTVKEEPIEKKGIRKFD